MPRNRLRVLLKQEDRDLDAGRQAILDNRMFLLNVQIPFVQRLLNLELHKDIEELEELRARRTYKE